MSIEEEPPKTPSDSLKSEIVEKKSFPPLRSDEVTTDSPSSELAINEQEVGKDEFYTEEDSQLQIEQPRSEFATLTTSSINISSPRSSEVTAVGAAEQQIASKTESPTTQKVRSLEEIPAEQQIASKIESPTPLKAPSAKEILAEQHTTGMELGELTTHKGSQKHEPSPPPPKKTFSAQKIIARLCSKFQIRTRTTAQPDATAQGKTKDTTENISH